MFRERQNWRERFRYPHTVTVRKKATGKELYIWSEVITCIPNVQEAQHSLRDLDVKYSEREKKQDELQKKDSKLRHEKVEYGLKLYTVSAYNLLDTPNVSQCCQKVDHNY